MAGGGVEPPKLSRRFTDPVAQPIRDAERFELANPIRDHPDERHLRSACWHWTAAAARIQVEPRRRWYPVKIRTIRGTIPPGLGSSSAVFAGISGVSPLKASPFLNRVSQEVA